MKKHTYIENGKRRAEVLTIDTPEDVTVTNPITGEVLTWNGIAWVNIEIPEHDIDGGSF